MVSHIFRSRQMYVRFDVIGEEILYFLNNGVFTQKARRIPYEWDPFQKLKKNDNL